jgi:uncharacterized protein (DUF1778 family)
MRLPESDLAVIDRAADLSGRSRTDFMRDAAVRAAEALLLETSVVRLDPAEFEAFKAALAAPAEADADMVELLRRPAPWDAA